jgi:hypothetical protein
VEREIMICLAGPPAQEKFQGHRRALGDREDIGLALDLAGYTCGTLGESSAYVEWLRARTSLLWKQPWYWRAVQDLARALGAPSRGRPTPGAIHGEGAMKTLTRGQMGDLAKALHDALNPRGEGTSFTWDCEHDHARVTRILGDMGLTYEQIEAAVEELKALGGHCDCEVMLNVVLPACDQRREQHTPLPRDGARPVMPTDVKQLEDPAFLAWVRERFRGGPVKPDPEDYDWKVLASTDAKRAEQHQLAQARKPMRMWADWKASLS